MDYQKYSGMGSYSSKNYTTFFICYNTPMEIILTHEQADFDAMAASYAASLLTGAFPVLPRKINKNVRSFITFYGQEFGFLDPVELQQGSIETVILVDTQSMITLKGVGKKTRVLVYDHHPLRSQVKEQKTGSIPPDWEIKQFSLGATTTFFVEEFQEQGKVITPVQATFLLLGIYEDTGSLSYSATTARDIRAAAWLLEQGAELSSVGEHLNPPLNLQQREIYDHLVANMELLEINGHQVMITCGETADPSDEISILAHKLRDLFDPDAIFVLVKTPDGVRLVARSTSDQIDVSLIAFEFGGGGHSRASAALIKKEHQEQPAVIDVRNQLAALLPRFISPVMTVSQIMSKRPRVITEKTGVDEAARLMARYGYEGFPVVKEGHVVGLLTRRVVDRAVSHKLNLTAASLMEVGDFAIHPGDSFQRLQNVMTESGWGQIPVIDPNSSKIIGIVTRTDVLKMLSKRHPQLLKYVSLEEKLKNNLSNYKFALLQAVAEQAASEHMPVYIVGGFVRDLLLEMPGSDLDLVVEGDAIKLAEKLVKIHGGKIKSHSRFGTARWYLETSSFENMAKSSLDRTSSPMYLDLISARQEFYEHPSALPTVEHSSIRLDLHRRDFTINTLALRIDGRYFGELHDYYGGMADLEKHLVRVLHSLSFIDDPTRMIRAVRYEQRYKFEIEPRTLQLIDEARSLLGRLSPERLRHEFELLLQERSAPVMMKRLYDLGLIRAINEILPWDKHIQKRLTDLFHSDDLAEMKEHKSTDSILQTDPAFCLWFLELTLDEINQIQLQFGFSNVTLKNILASAELFSKLKNVKPVKPSEWVEILDGFPQIAVRIVYFVTNEYGLGEYLSKWQNIQAHTNGHSLKMIGLRPGPNYQGILRSLRNAWLDGDVRTQEEENTLLQKMLINTEKI